MWHESAEILSLQILNLSIKANWCSSLDWRSLDKMVDWNGSLARISGLKLSDFKFNKIMQNVGIFLAQQPNSKQFNFILFLFFNFLFFQKHKILCWPTGRQRNNLFSQIHKFSRAKILRGTIKGDKFLGVKI